MAVCVSPVIHATKAFMNSQLLKEEGKNIYSKLLNWVFKLAHPDHDEAISVIVFMARRLLQEQVVSQAEFKLLVDQASTILHTQKVSQAVAQFFKREGYGLALLDINNDSPVDESKDNKEDFEKLLSWLSLGLTQNDKYDRSTIRIFSIPLNMWDREEISQEEQEIMCHRAFSVLIPDPQNHAIQDKDYLQFLKQRGFNLQEIL